MEKYETRLKKVLEDMSYAINHLEDMVADNRAVLIKLVKQNNTIVQFLKDIVIDPIEDVTPTYVSENEKIELERNEKIQELVEEFKEKHKDLEEFEEEMKKHKDKLTPGQIGES